MNDTILLDYLRILLRHRRTIMINAVVIVAIAVIMSFAWPKRYKAVSTFVPAFEVETQFTRLIESQRVDFGLLLASQQTALTDLYAALLDSRRLKETVIVSCGLMNIYRMESLENMLRKFDRLASVDIERGEVVVVEITTNQPTLSADIANAWVAALDTFNQQVMMSQSRKKRLFLERRISEVSTHLDEAEDSLDVFQKRYKTVSLSEEITNVLEVYTDLQRSLLTKEVQLYSMPEAESALPLYQSLLREIRATRGVITSIEKRSVDGYGAGFGIPLSRIAALQIEYNRRVFKKNSLGQLHDYLQELYEDARIEEQRNTPTIVTIDRAIPPEKKEWPRRLTTLLIGCAIAILFGLITPLYAERKSRSA